MSTIKTNNAQIGQSVTATNNFTWYQPASPDGTVRLGVGNSGATSLDAVTINSSGNLGLGVTPSAWSLGKAFETSAGSFFGYSTNEIHITQNTYYNAGWKYTNSSVGSGRYLINAGTHSWFTAPSGTAGNPITFTQAMTLDASGNLLVGKTSASYSASGRGVVEVYGSTDALYNWQNATGNFYIQKYAENVFFSNSNAGNLIFSNNGSERVRIDSSGNLLVGTTSALGKLAVVGSGTTGGTYACSIYNSGTALTMFLARDDGFVFLPSTAGKTTGSAANLYIDSGNGAVYRSTSSLKYKQNIQNAVHGLAEVLQLRAVTYEGKSETDAGKTFGGLIAEEVHDAGLTEFVQYADDGTPDALAYGNMVSLCIKAIQELSAQTTALKAELDATKAEVAALKGV